MIPSTDSLNFEEIRTLCCAVHVLVLDKAHPAFALPFIS